MGREILDAIPPEADYRISYGPGEHHFGELRLPDSPGPYALLISIHGGFWRAAFSLSHMGHLCAALADRGMASWNVEYRRLGHEGGGWPGSAEDVVEGAMHIVRLARDFPLDLTRVVVAGYSAGGQLALWLAANRKLKLRGAVSLAGVVDLRRAWELKLSDGIVGEYMGGSPDAAPERYAAASPIDLLPFRLPIRLIHGTEDSRVPYEISERFLARAAAKHEDCSLDRLEGADHYELIDPNKPECDSVQQTIMELASRG
jgi:acetyl esterase/lipase